MSGMKKGFIRSFIDNKNLIIDLAKTDLRNKYAVSFFGAVWAFVQPIVTILIYLFVFQIGFKAGDTSNGYPFVLFLVSGIIPWFFFAESWMNSTNCLMEYSYLVKKVVFKIEILPMVKIVSTLFVHMFFVFITFLLFTIERKMPGIHIIQIVYYLFCTMSLVLALSYFTCSITPFFPDTVQIVGILTQLGMWTIPVMYEETIIPENIMRILRFSPMYYVVTGYRDCFMNGQWFWERGRITIYFWIVVLVFYIIGKKTFDGLRIHFADVI